jgi:hypothetical protein
MKRLAVAVFGLLVASVAVGADGVDIFETPIATEPLNAKVISESYEPKIISAWMESIAVDEAKKRVYIARKTEYFINCKDSTMLTKSSYMYDKNGNIIKSYTNDSVRKPISYASGYASMPPNSIGELFIKNSCGIINGTYKNPDGYTGFLEYYKPTQ